MKKKILILEDEVEIAELYAKRLGAKGYETVLAGNGVEGLQKLKNMTPDLILLDVNMPEMGGLEFYQHICDAKQRPKYPVLVLTGRADLEKLFREFEVNGILIKPFENSTLMKEVDIIFSSIEPKKLEGAAYKAVIVDDDYAESEKISAEMRKAGYTVDNAKSGIAGIEKIMNEQPDLVLVKLGLADIPGDLVILRLQQIARTKHARTILYVSRVFDHDKIVLEKMSQKSGVSKVLEYGHPQELVEAAKEVLKKKRSSD